MEFILKFIDNISMEGFLFFLLLSGIIGIGSILFSIVRRKRISKILSHAAQKYKLIFKKGNLLEYPSVSGTIDQFHIYIQPDTSGLGNIKTQTIKFEIDIKYRKLSPYSISAEGLISHLKKIFTKKDILTGDTSFDNEVLIQGYNNIQLCSLLNKKARSLISYFLNSAYKKNFYIDNHQISYYIPLGNLRTEQTIEYILNKAILLAKIFCRKGEAADLLKENYLTETVDEVKINLLSTLYSIEGYLPVDNPVIKKALADESDVIQFFGVRCLKDAGYEHLEMLYESGDMELKKLILFHLKKEKVKYFIKFFLKEMEKESILTIKKELVDYFRIIGDVKAESCLRMELDKKRNNESIPEFLSYKSLIIRALQYCGTYESIEALYNIRHITLKREADMAITMIRNRIGTGDKGCLSMIPGIDEAGNLSLTDEQIADD